MLNPHLLLSAYAEGIFPMAESRDSAELHWIDPRLRGVIGLDHFHISRSLRRAILRGDYSVTLDRAFTAVVDGCADRAETWINAELRDSYLDLHRLGHAHSIEVWDTGGDLIGGVYGVTLGAAFFGESMFSRRTDASKIALAWLVCHLRRCGFMLFDTQFLTPHLASLGGRELPRSEYHRLLEDALGRSARFYPPEFSPSPSEVAGSAGASGSTQDKTQTS